MKIVANDQFGACSVCHTPLSNAAEQKCGLCDACGANVNESYGLPASMDILEGPRLNDMDRLDEGAGTPLKLTTLWENYDDFLRGVNGVIIGNYGVWGANGNDTEVMESGMMHADEHPKYESYQDYKDIIVEQDAWDDLISSVWGDFRSDPQFAAIFTGYTEQELKDLQGLPSTASGAVRAKMKAALDGQVWSGISFGHGYDNAHSVKPSTMPKSGKPGMATSVRRKAGMGYTGSFKREPLETDRDMVSVGGQLNQISWIKYRSFESEWPLYALKLKNLKTGAIKVLPAAGVVTAHGDSGYSGSYGSTVYETSFLGSGTGARGAVTSKQPEPPYMTSDKKERLVAALSNPDTEQHDYPKGTTNDRIKSSLGI
jgi:hypothetical protein